MRESEGQPPSVKLSVAAGFSCENDTTMPVRVESGAADAFVGNWGNSDFSSVIVIMFAL